MDLLFAHDDGDPFLANGPDEKSAANEVAPVELRQETHLADISSHASDLTRQRWAIVVSDDSHGEKLAALAGDLVTKRAEDQQAEVLTIRVPPGMDGEAAARWKKTVYPDLYGQRELRRPRYLCILGDFDRVSLETQQALATDGFPGRLVCPDDEGYQAYVAKITAWEASPASQAKARSLFYTVHDGSAATASAYDGLIRPCYAACQDLLQNEPRELPAESISEHGSRYEPDPDEFLDLMAERHPSVMLSVSHGMGPPRNRAWAPTEARQRQGAMCFGGAGSLLPDDVANAPFLPGGMWLYFACFGAGTPTESAYHHWLAMLAEQGQTGMQPLCNVIDSLSKDGGYTSGIAQAALANSNGPLAIMGHIDLAWSYAYQDVESPRRGPRGTNRAKNFRDLVAAMVRGERAGVTILNLQKFLGGVGNELNSHYDRQKKRGQDSEGTDQAEKRALGNLWMLRQDLQGYVLLGDPAARLPLAPAKAKSPRDRRARFSAALGFARPPRREASDHREPTDNNKDDQLASAEEAILGLATGTLTPRQVARKLEISRAQANQWADAYREAGRQVLRRLLDEEDA